MNKNSDNWFAQFFAIVGKKTQNINTTKITTTRSHNKCTKVMNTIAFVQFTSTKKSVIYHHCTVHDKLGKSKVCVCYYEIIN